MHLKNYGKSDNRENKTKIRTKGIPLLLAVAFFVGGCQTPPSQRAKIPSDSVVVDPHNRAGQVGGNADTGEVTTPPSGLSVTKPADGQNTVHVSGTLEGKIALVNFDAEVSLPKEQNYPVYSAWPLDTNKDIDRGAWLELAFGEEASRAAPISGTENSNLEFRYQIKDNRYVGYIMPRASFRFIDHRISEPIYSAEDRNDVKEVQGTPPGCSFTQEEAITKASEILSRYGIEEGFTPMGVTAVAYNNNRQGYYTIEWERSLSGLPVFRHSFLSTVGGTLNGDSLSVSLNDEGIIKISGTVHKFTESSERHPVIPLEQALKVFERNLDFVWVGLDENREKIPQELDDIRLIYMPISDPTAEKKDATILIANPSSDTSQSKMEKSEKPNIMVPAWYFSAEPDDQGGSRTINARSVQYRMIINAISSEVIR